MPPNRSKTLSKEARLLLALNAIQSGQIKIVRQAARVFKVGRLTLQDQIKGRVPRERFRHPNNLLSQIEEDELIAWILEMERCGFPAYIIDI